MVATNLIKETPEQQELFRLLYPADSNGIHQVRYGLTATDYNNGDLTAGPGTPPSVIPFNATEQAFVQSVFSRLAREIRIQGIQENNLSNPMQIVSVQAVRDDGGDALTSGITRSGFKIVTSSGVKTLMSRPDSYVTIEVELNDDAGLSDSEQRTITHEIGHGLGLDHPNNNPDDPAYNDQDTIMSYNVGGSKPATWFSASDINALKEIWGDNSKSGTDSGGSGTDDTTADHLLPNSYLLDSVTGQIIDGFESGRDKLVISAALPGLKSVDLRSVSGSRKVFNKKGLMAPTQLVYWATTGELYFNANGKAKGFGAGGGLLADLGALTPLVRNDLILG